MQPLISIIVPIYNVEQYLPRCIESILAQTYRNLEIILIDDGSPDNCGKICDEYAKKDDRIVVIHQENTGIAVARKPGVRHAKGEYIGFVDGDDWIESGMYQHMMEKMLLHDVDFVAVGLSADYEDHSISHVNKKRLMHKEEHINKNCKFFFDYLDENPFSVALWNKLFKREIPEQFYLCIPNDIKSLTDSFCTYSYMPYIESAYISDEIYYRYNKINTGAVTQNFGMKNMRDLIKLYEYLQERYSTLDENEILMNRVDDLYARLVIRFLPNRLKQRANRYSFPIKTLLTNQKVVIYGAGVVGVSVFTQLSKINNIDIVKVVDKYKAGEYIENVKIDEVKEITLTEFDKLIIAVLNRNTAEEIINELTSDFKIDKSKIIWERPITPLQSLLS